MLMAISPVNIQYIPDDLLLNCLARVSRSYYPTLSLVSKRFRSLVSSHELYEIRTLLGRTEPCLYVCLRLASEAYPRLFTLCRRPTQILNPNPNHNLKYSGWFTSCFRGNRILTNRTMKEGNKSSDNVLASVSSVPNFTTLYPSRLTRTNLIYMFGRIPSCKYSSKELFFMDCRSHTWHRTPSMQVAQKEPLSSSLDGKVYVVEGCKNPDYSNFIEVFDPITQTWEHVPSPSAEIRGTYILGCLAFDGKLYMFGDKRLVYEPKGNKWDVVGLEMPFLWTPSRISCVVDNVIYSYGFYRTIMWYDSEGRSWRILKGLNQGPNKLPNNFKNVRLVNHGGKIVVLWEKTDSKKKMLRCAQIALERRNGQEIYGKIEWCDVVLTVPKSCSVLGVTTATV